MINSVYGKTMENVRKRINVRLVNDKKDFLNYTTRPNYVTHKLFDKDLAAFMKLSLFWCLTNQFMSDLLS